jgi:hypothetical protein
LYFRQIYILLYQLLVNHHCNSQLYIIMSHVITKPTLWVCDQHGSRPACASAQSDQDPFCLLSVSLVVIGFVSEQHGSWSNCADVWVQAGRKPICWFCHSAAHKLKYIVYSAQLDNGKKGKYLNFTEDLKLTLTPYHAKYMLLNGLVYLSIWTKPFII